MMYGEQPPDIVVNFQSKVLACGHPTICALSMADTPVQEGQDMAVGFSRAETASFMAARGPDFREAFSSRTPASPADMMPTIAALAGWKAGADAKKDARELTETPARIRGKAGATRPHAGGELEAVGSWAIRRGASAVGERVRLPRGSRWGGG